MPPWNPRALFWECSNTYCSDSDLFSKMFGVFHLCHYAKARGFGILCQCSQAVSKFVVRTSSGSAPTKLFCSLNFLKSPVGFFSPGVYPSTKKWLQCWCSRNPANQPTTRFTWNLRGGSIWVGTLNLLGDTKTYIRGEKKLWVFQNRRSPPPGNVNDPNIHIWVFPKIGVPQNGWFIMENLIKMADLRGTIIFGNTHIITGGSSLLSLLTPVH